MPDKKDVEAFLRDLHGKMLVYEIVYRPRDKNLNSLAALELKPVLRNEIIRTLTYKDCFSGPNKDTQDNTRPDHYEFGKVVNGETIYIKISLGKPNKCIDCMSFHIAERGITYPLKNL